MQPTFQELEAVHKVLYSPARVQKLEDLLCDIGTRMNLQTLPCGATIPNRGPNYGKGPRWYYVQGATLYKRGKPKLSPFVTEAADRCDRVAAVILEMHDEMAHVNIPASVKADIRTGLSELAASWKERGAMWRDPNAAHGEAQVQAISARFRASMKAFEPVRHYLG